MKAIQRFLVRHPLAAFFLLAYGLTWALELPVVLGHLQGRMGLADGTLLLFLGSFGPLWAAFAVQAVVEGREGVRAWLERLLRWRVGLRWYLVALYGFLVLGTLAVLLLRVASPADVVSGLSSALVGVPLNALTTFVILGPLGEEPGWRGYALPQLQARHGALVASLILGVLWALWHGPLLLFPEWRGDLAAGTFLILYPLYVLPLTVIFTWLYNQTGGSALLTIVLHAAYNSTLFTFNNRFEIDRYDQRVVLGVLGALFWLVALGLVGLSGPDLGRRGAR